jgi:hypothetical protein
MAIPGLRTHRRRIRCSCGFHLAGLTGDEEMRAAFAAHRRNAPSEDLPPAPLNRAFSSGGGTSERLLEEQAAAHDLPRRVLAEVGGISQIKNSPSKISNRKWTTFSKGCLDREQQHGKYHGLSRHASQACLAGATARVGAAPCGARVRARGSRPWPRQQHLPVDTRRTPRSAILGLTFRSGAASPSKGKPASRRAITQVISNWSAGA